VGGGKLAFQAELKLTSLVETPNRLSFASWGRNGRWGRGYAKKGWQVVKERGRDDVKLTPSTGAALINGSVYALKKSSAGKNCMAGDVSSTDGYVFASLPTN